MSSLFTYTIYKPHDRFKTYTVCRFRVTAGVVTKDGLVGLCPNLEDLRDYLQNHMGLTVLPREEQDDPLIVETWL